MKYNIDEYDNKYPRKKFNQKRIELSLFNSNRLYTNQI